jgi:hypothetical protein
MWQRRPVAGVDRKRKMSNSGYHLRGHSTNNLISSKNAPFYKVSN